MSVERRYRRWLRLLPAEWRARHADAMVATFLDEVGEARRVPVVHVVDVVRAALVLRGRGVLAAARGGGVVRVGVRICLPAVAAAGVAAVAATVSPAFLATSLLVALAPGTGVVYTIGTTVAGGWRAGVAAAVGCTLGVVPHLVAAVLGLSGVVHVGAGVFRVVRWLGVAYLVGLGVSMLLARRDVVGEHAGAPPAPSSRLVRRGVTLNLLNPKLTLFFFAFLPQFLPADPSPVDPRLLLLGTAFMVVTFVVFAGYAAVTALLRTRVLTAARARRWLVRGAGGAMVGLGLHLAADGT